jgi:hypothetical protein
VNKADLRYILCTVYAGLTPFFYCCIWWFSIKLPRYYPTLHLWKMAKDKGVPSQGWYGMQGFAFLAAGIVTAIVYVCLRKAVKEDVGLSPGTSKWIGLGATLLIVICMGCIMQHEFGKWGVW